MKTAPAVAAGERFFTTEAERIARLCHAMSDRFARGGRLIAVGCSPQARSDARHVAVEFVHPVIVGKRALPALAVTHEPQQLELLAEPDDMVMAFDDSCGWTSDDSKPVYLSIGYGDSGAEWDFDPGCDDPFVAQELVETHYHLLWELVHVFFEHRGRQGGAAQDGGAAAWLYPMLGERARDPEAVVRDVAASVLMKSEEVSALRTQTLEENEEALNGAAAAMRHSFAKHGTAPDLRQRRIVHRRDGRGRRHVVSTQGPGAPTRRSTFPTTRRSSRRSPTTSASGRSSRAR